MYPSKFCKFGVLLAILISLNYLVFSQNTIGRNKWRSELEPLYVFGRFKLQVDGRTEYFDDTKLPTSSGSKYHLVHLGRMFPYYGGLYNHTLISKDGNINFADLIYKGKEFRVGKDQAKNWPKQSDPAMIAPYLCAQETEDVSEEIPLLQRPAVYHRIVSAAPRSRNTDKKMRKGLITGSEATDFLKMFKFDLQRGIVGSSTFYPHTALVVTWRNTNSPTIGYSEQTTATYQLVWATDEAATTSYVMFNYHQLGFDADDVVGSTHQGKCVSYFNGGNATGSVHVWPGDEAKHKPSILATISPGPVKGRFYFRVDDVVQRGGCSEKHTGTVPFLIYPNIVNMLGGVTVDVNGLCWDEGETLSLYVGEYGESTAGCKRITRAIARCTLPSVQGWGTKDVYLQPTSSSGDLGSRAYVGYMYFVPPGIDPMSLDIGSIYDWYKNPIKQDKHKKLQLTWYPKNFTSHTIPKLDVDHPDNLDRIYTVNLDLFVVGYREVDDPDAKKILPKHKILAKITSFSNNPQKLLQKEDFPLLKDLTDDIWLISPQERKRTLRTYRIGYFKLSVQQDDDFVSSHLEKPAALLGLISAPISLHWLWSAGSSGGNATATMAGEMCQMWYNEDGRQDNFIRHTETQAPCPCKMKQARADMGRFMPHPRCSRKFRSQSCTVNLGSSDCFMSATNVQHYTSKHSKPVGTHYGQVCCYDSGGYLMHTSYQPVIKTEEKVPYSPGFPLRANEFGTQPYSGQFQVPVLSALYHDVMPYFFCCKWTKNKCQFFYWRRPSSGCQDYKAPMQGVVMGAGHFVPMDNYEEKFTFNDPGIFTLLHIPADPELGRGRVDIQIRLERYPNRTLNYFDPASGITFVWSLVDKKKKSVFFCVDPPQQEELVQPGTGTVLTGVALKEDHSDTVQILLRKDTRRYKYRTNIVVGEKLRYFDKMWLQRYKGILIYVNVISGMQSEIYVVMEKPQIGLKIRESYAVDIKQAHGETETKGILDLKISMAPIQKIGPDGREPLDKKDTVQGLIYSGAAKQSTSELIRKFKVAGWGKNPIVSEGDWNNLFVVNDDTSKAWKTKDLVEEPVYKYKGQNKESTEFQMIDPDETNRIIATCGGRDKQTDIKGYKCSKDVHKSDVTEACGSDDRCTYDYVVLYQRTIAEQTKLHYQKFKMERKEASRHYNSCAPMNIEYPEYLKMQGPTEPKYLDGNTVNFECYDSHWIKGRTSYTCTKKTENGKITMGWNHGSQPWCRDRKRAVIYKWLAAMFGLCMIFAVLVIIFLCCWCCKVKHKKAEAAKREQYKLTTLYATVPVPEEHKEIEPGHPAENEYMEPQVKLHESHDNSSFSDAHSSGEEKPAVRLVSAV